MRVFGKIASGVCAAAAIYFCVDMLLMGSKNVPTKAPSVAKEEPQRQVEPPAPLVERIAAPVQEPSRVQAASPSADPAPAEHPQQVDRTAELTATLEAQYSIDPRPTRAALDKQKAIEALFSQPELEGKGHLQELDCRETICRGVVKITNQESDNAVFSGTFGSPKFASAIPDAVTVASRQKMADGSVVATFYIHPQSIFAMLGP